MTALLLSLGLAPCRAEPAPAPASAVSVQELASVDMLDGFLEILEFLYRLMGGDPNNLPAEPEEAMVMVTAEWNAHPGFVQGLSFTDRAAAVSAINTAQGFVNLFGGGLDPAVTSSFSHTLKSMKESLLLSN